MSAFSCPECRVPAPADARAGTPYACPSCGNPVLPVTRRLRPEVEEPVQVRTAFWKISIVAFVVLGAAYLGVYELLTAEAKRERDRLVAKHGSAIVAFEAPSTEAATGGAAELRDYREKQARYEDRKTYESRISRIDTMFTALLLAFAGQSLFTAILLTKTALRAKKASKARAARV